jgi:hypothetical protein
VLLPEAVDVVADARRTMVYVIAIGGISWCAAVVCAVLVLECVVCVV